MWFSLNKKAWIGWMLDLWRTAYDCPQYKAGPAQREGEAKMGQGPGQHQIHAVVENHQAEHQATVIETTARINNLRLSILIYPGATDSFISHFALTSCGLKAQVQDDFKLVEMALGCKESIGSLVKECVVQTGDCYTKMKLYSTALGSYDLIIGMDWL